LHPILAAVSSFLAGAAFAKCASGSVDAASAAARVIYLFGGNDLPVFLLAAFAKNERDDLTPTERSLMAKAVAAMLADYRRRQ
jgi:hypothetical protein